MNEKDLLQKIIDDAKEVTPPASLSPENVEQMLRNTPKQAKRREGSQNEAAENHSPIGEEKTAKTNVAANEIKPGEKTVSIVDRKKKKSYRILRYGSLAAVVAVAFTAFWQYRHTLISPKLQSEMDSFTVPETELVSRQEKNKAQSSISKEKSSAAEDSTGKEGSAIAEDSPESMPETGKQAKVSSPTAEHFTYASSYEEIYQALQDLNSKYKTSILYDTGVAYDAEFSQEERAMEDSAPKSAAGSDSAASGDFSQTNLQEEGVDEGDIVKTDGTYIYVLRQDLSLVILKADGKDSQVVSVTELSPEGDASIREMYLDGDTVNILLSEYTTSLEQTEPETDMDIIYYTDSHRQARILTYDVSDRSKPVQTGDVAQDGSYSESRKNGDYLYLFTRYSPDLQDTYEESTIVPRLGGSTIPAEAFYVPENLRSCDYLVISSLDISNPGEILDCKVLVSGASTFYVSGENIYIANETYDSSQTRTEITKFHYGDGQITGMAAGSVKGYLNNSFSLNEYQGNLRVVSTYYGDEYNNVRDMVSNLTGTYFEQNWTEHNALYVLDENLEQIGAIEGLAEGETIRSARFFGDTGYFVTFRQTDPLFSVDLSDPADPRILGELKISGFSSYLHFYGENLLLGIGYEADEDTGTISGLKLSMFDISDPANVTEVNRLVLPGITWCPAIEDYKTILADPEKNLIGFFCDNRYMVFSYDKENGFTRELLYDFYSDMLGSDTGYDTMRGLYIGDDFYLAGNTFLISFDMTENFAKESLLNIE